MSLTTPREPTLATLIIDAIKSRLTDFRVSLPCKIAAYNSSDGTVDVDILIKDQRLQSDGTVKLNAFPTIKDVPIQWYRCGTCWITLPLKVGDLGKLVFADRNLSNWSAANKGEVVDPKDLGMHNLAGATFEPGLYPASAAIPSPDPDNIVIHADTKVMLGEKGLDDTKLVALAKLVKDEITALRNTVNNNVSTFNGHTHLAGTLITGPSPGSPVTGATGTSPSSESAPAAVNDVKATKVYAK